MLSSRFTENSITDVLKGIFKNFQILLLCLKTATNSCTYSLEIFSFVLLLQNVYFFVDKLTDLHIYLPTNRPTFLPIYLPVYLVNYLSIYQTTYLPKYLPTYLPT